MVTRGTGPESDKEKGEIASIEVMLILSILVVGMIVGASAVRIALVMELEDVAKAFGAVNQGYQASGEAGHHASRTGSSFEDAPDTSDLGSAVVIPPVVEGY